MIASLPRFLRSQSLRLAAALSLSAAALLSACSSGSTFEPLVPTRFISFGDGMSDVGQSGNRYTVNDGSVNIWAQQLAASYGGDIKPSNNGGLGYASGNARINSGANAISSQITAFLATGSIGANDVLIIDAGISELVALTLANASDSDLATAADLAGKALGAQVKRLTAAGGQRVVVGNAIDLGKTPFATALSRSAALSAATRAFNDGIKLSLADVTQSVLLLDNEAIVNGIYLGSNVLGSGTNLTTAACSTPTALTCTPSTLAATVTNYDVHLYADDRYPTPAVHRLIGTNAYNSVRFRW